MMVIVYNRFVDFHEGGKFLVGERIVDCSVMYESHLITNDRF